ncbi:MAG: flagellar motor switch protein FliM, partial [Bdellovibrionales bacterium]|nr:flagellar motor switch protein FliM [Bdellovibrionales bacterium]
VTTLEVELESASGTIMVVMPYSTIEPIKQKLSSSFQTDNDMTDSIWVNAMEKSIEDCNAELVVTLGETEISIGDLLNLEKGDVLPLKQEVSKEVSVGVGGKEKLKCIIGEYKGSRAIQVTKKV